MQIQDVKLAVVGLGYVGLPLAVEFGKKRSVLGYFPQTSALLQRDDGYSILPDFRGESP